MLREITKEQYERAHGVFYKVLDKEDYESVFTDSEKYGYGVYSDECIEKDGKYYVQYSLGSTCD